MVDRVWGTFCEAELHCQWSARTGIVLENIKPDDRIIWLKPGETILGHTNEFVGGRWTVTTMMKARSSLGRNFIEVCKCAGWYTHICTFIIIVDSNTANNFQLVPFYLSNFFFVHFSQQYWQSCLLSRLLSQGHYALFSCLD
jgi:hypothetical protein